MGAEETVLHVKGIETKTDANALRLASHEETSSRAISRVNQTLLDRAEEIDLHVKGIEAKTDASALRLASYEETSARAIANVSHTLFQLQGKLDTLSTGLVYPIGTVTHDGQCMEPVPGSDMIGRFVDPRTMNIGRSAVELSCQDGKKYRNPFDEHGSSEIEYDLPDPIATVTHHAETDASASVNTFQNVDQKRQAVASEKGFNIGFMGILSVGVSEATQRMTGFFRDARSRVYEVVRRFGSFEAIPKGNPNQYLVPEVKYALNALPRAYFAEHSKKFIDVFNPYDLLRRPSLEWWQVNGYRRSQQRKRDRGREQCICHCVCACVCVCVFVGRVSWDHPSTTLFTKHSTPPLFSSSPPPPFRPPLRCRQ